MRDVDERDADFTLDALQLHLHGLPELEVQRAERLVEQQCLRVIDQRPGQGHPLLLATGQLTGPSLLTAGQVDDLQHLADLAGDPVSGHVPSPQPERDVLEHVHVREQGVGLEHHVDVALVRRLPVTSRPCRLTVPRVGSSNPATIRIVVVFPQPDGPSMEKNSPWRMARSMPRTAATSSPRTWNSLATPASSIAGGSCEAPASCGLARISSATCCSLIER